MCVEVRTVQFNEYFPELQPFTSNTLPKGLNVDTIGPFGISIQYKKVATTTNATA
jgi:hypothetical protein